MDVIHLTGNGEAVAATARPLGWSCQPGCLLTLPRRCNSGRRRKSLWFVTQVSCQQLSVTVRSC